MTYIGIYNILKSLKTLNCSFDNSNELNSTWIISYKDNIIYKIKNIMTFTSDSTIELDDYENDLKNEILAMNAKYGGHTFSFKRTANKLTGREIYY